MTEHGIERLLIAQAVWENFGSTRYRKTLDRTRHRQTLLIAHDTGGLSIAQAVQEMLIAQDT